MNQLDLWAPAEVPQLGVTQEPHQPQSEVCLHQTPLVYLDFNPICTQQTHCERHPEKLDSRTNVQTFVA